MAKAGEAYGFRLSLFKDGAIVNDPTLAAGDVIVVQDDGTTGNITSLPTALAADKDIVEVSLSSDEMGGSAGDTVTVKFEDAAGDEWEPVTIDIPLTTRDVDDLAYPATSGRDLAVDANGRVDVSLVEGLDATDQMNTACDTAISDAALATAAAQAVIDVIVDTILARLGVPADLGSGATVAGNLQDIEGQTDDIGAGGAGLDSIPWNASWDAEVESEVEDAVGADITNILLDTGTTIPAIIAALNDLSAADVLAQLNAYDGPTYDELLAFIQLLTRDDAGIAVDRAAALADINADEGSGAGAYDNTVGSLEEIGGVVGGVAVFPAGAIEWAYTIYEPDGITPIPGADVWISTDLAGANIIWRGTTDAFGAARDVNNNQPFLDAGTYYFWRQAAGYVFTNPDTEVVS